MNRRTPEEIEKDRQHADNAQLMAHRLSDNDNAFDLFLRRIDELEKENAAKDRVVEEKDRIIEAKDMDIRALSNIIQNAFDVLRDVGTRNAAAQTVRVIANSGSSMVNSHPTTPTRQDQNHHDDVVKEEH